VPVKHRQIALLGREVCRSARTAPIAIKIWRFRLILGPRSPLNAGGVTSSSLSSPSSTLCFQRRGTEGLNEIVGRDLVASLFCFCCVWSAKISTKSLTTHHIFSERSPTTEPYTHRSWPSKTNTLITNCQNAYHGDGYDNQQVWESGQHCKFSVYPTLKLY
jgi:hypothetical protein